MQFIEALGHGLLAFFGAVMAALHPWAAAGASFGCVFYLMTPAVLEGWRKGGYTVSAWGIGYAFALFTHGGGPPYSEAAMFPAAIASALGIMLLTVTLGAGDKGGPLPPIVSDILDRIPLLRRKGPSDGS